MSNVPSPPDTATLRKLLDDVNFCKGQTYETLVKWHIRDMPHKASFRVWVDYVRAVLTDTPALLDHIDALTRERDELKDRIYELERLALEESFRD